MKRILLLLIFLPILFSCNNKNKEKEETQIEDTKVMDPVVQTYEGEFIYTPDAAVLKGNSFVYGVELNEVAKDLGKKVEAIEKGEYDMVPVTVRGEVHPKMEGTEGWDEVITITEIVNISKTPIKADVELKENKG